MRFEVPNFVRELFTTLLQGHDNLEGVKIIEETTQRLVCSPRLRTGDPFPLQRVAARTVEAMAREELHVEEDCSAIEALGSGRISASVAVLRDSLLSLCAAKAVERSVSEGTLMLSVETSVHHLHHQAAEGHSLPAGCTSPTRRMSLGMCLTSRGVCLLDFGDLEGTIKSITRMAHGATVSLFLACKVSTKIACLARRVGEGN
jgi:hypothetical protein